MEFFKEILDFSIINFIDIIFVAFLLYYAYKLLRGTVAINIFLGIILIYLVWNITAFLKMDLLSSIIGGFMSVGIIALIVVFQPEIRKILAKLGEKQFGIFASEEEAEKVIEEIVRASKKLSEDRIGGLIVIEREVNLDNYIEAGTMIDGKISKELLVTIFWPGTPLHDGAVIVRRNKVHKAGAFLPLSLNPNLPQTVGTRHRAAIGITEETDAIVVVISEETGSVSVSYTGKLIKNLDPQKLKKVLKGLLVRKKEERKKLLDYFKRRNEETV
ncbi:MAG: diadenylate cyclase CdaA [Desulfurobacteriaceae bacterium]